MVSKEYLRLVFDYDSVIRVSKQENTVICGNRLQFHTNNSEKPKDLSVRR